MVFLKDLFVLGGAAILAVGLGGVFIFRGAYVPTTQIGYLRGTILSYEVVVTKSGMATYFHLQLDTGDTVRVASGQRDATSIPGDRVCIRASKEGNLVQGWLVADEKCGSTK